MDELEQILAKCFNTCLSKDLIPDIFKRAALFLSITPVMAQS